MCLEILYHTLKDGEKAKFTIRSRMINGELFYYAQVVNTELDYYKNLTDIAKESYYGIEITNGKGKSINYRDLNRLKNDMLTKYGNEWLETES